jgi:methylated-DNA-[protein]-cysteine S-methyltransferase
MKFREKVYRETSRITRGRVATYSYIARKAGSPGAVRAVGNILNRNPSPGTGGRIPCHRVVRSDRKPGGFARGTREKTNLLEMEGIVIEDGRIPERFFL